MKATNLPVLPPILPKALPNPFAAPLMAGPAVELTLLSPSLALLWNSFALSPAFEADSLADSAAFVAVLSNLFPAPGSLAERRRTVREIANDILCPN